jgi:hypothetical protein
MRTYQQQYQCERGKHIDKQCTYGRVNCHHQFHTRWKQIRKRSANAEATRESRRQLPHHGGMQQRIAPDHVKRSFMLLRKVGRKIASNCTSPSATIIPLKLKHLDDAHHQLWKPGNMRSAAWPYGYIINVQPQLQHAHVKPSPFPTICMKMRNFLDITARQSDQTRQALQT